MYKKSGYIQHPLTTNSFFCIFLPVVSETYCILHFMIPENDCLGQHMCLNTVNICALISHSGFCDWWCWVGERDTNCLVCHWGNHWNTNKYLKNQNNSINKVAVCSGKFDSRFANTCISIWKTDTIWETKANQSKAKITNWKLQSLIYLREE